MKYVALHHSELEEKKPIVVKIKEKEIGLIKNKDTLYAYENICPHFGGPVCLGGVFGKIEMELDSDKMALKEKVSDEELRLVCPWHGFEFNLDSGQCVFDETLNLKRYDVFLEEGYVCLDL